MIALNPGAAAVAVALVLAAAVWDMACRRIPNRLTLFLLTVWCVFLGIEGVRHGGAILRVAELPEGVGAAVAVLCVGYVLFSRRLVGAGDVKLAAVACLWAGKEAGTFLIAASLVGGLLVLQLPLLRRLEMLGAFFLTTISRRWDLDVDVVPVGDVGARDRGMPYGPALAAGFAFTVLHAWS